jgi:hypothetical protein
MGINLSRKLICVIINSGVFLCKKNINIIILEKVIITNNVSFRGSLEVVVSGQLPGFKLKPNSGFRWNHYVTSAPQN